MERKKRLNWSKIEVWKLCDRWSYLKKPSKSVDSIMESMDWILTFQSKASLWYKHSEGRPGILEGRSQIQEGNKLEKITRMWNLLQICYLHVFVISDSNGIRQLTTIPRAVLVKKRYRKFPSSFSAVRPLMLLTLSDWTALKSTIEVASLTTPSPKTTL